jgi:hypothetical protein
MTPSQLTEAFGVYFTEIERCEQQRCYWALLHVLLVIPDICGSLEDPKESSGDRYIRWCRENMPSNALVGPGDRYQMRNAVLHEGTTLSDNMKTKNLDKQTIYECFSFVDPSGFDAPIHQTVNSTGEILNINVANLALDTKQALRTWFARLQQDPTKMSEVERNLSKLARVKPKVAHLQKQGLTGVVIVEHRGITTSSS